jgi:LPXTG-site transpeptidase (sortase) family protein
MKFFVLLLISAVSFEAYFSLLLFYFSHISNKESIIQESITQDLPPKNLISQDQIINKSISPGLPTFLTIPTINIQANIQDLGINSDGEMDIPNNIIDVGWFKFGSRPGEKGSAVIAGHFDGENGKGVFTNLNKLKEGDKLYVKDDHGTSFVFVVRESRIYDPGYVEEVFNSNDSPHLNLVTCDGVWDENKKSYNKRLVVFTDLETNI